MKTQGQDALRRLAGLAVGGVALIHAKDVAVAEDAAAATLSRLGFGPDRRWRVSAEDLPSALDRLDAVLSGAGLFGPAEAVWVVCDEDPKAAVLSALEVALARAGTLEAPVLVSAGELGTRAKLRQVFEAHAVALAAMLYPDRPAELGALLTAAAERAGVGLSPEVRDGLVERFPADRRGALNALEGLVLTVGPGGTIGREALATTDAAGEGEDANGLAEVFFQGSRAGFVTGWDRLMETGGNPTTVLRAVLRRAQQIAVVQARDTGGGSLMDAGRAGGVFVQDWMLRELEPLARAWPWGRLARLIADLNQIEAGARQAGTAEAALVRHLLMARLAG
jgi:DNA polymerase III delta subunit